MKLNRSKAHGPDGIPGWVLKENADLLAAPIADILNSSYREGRLPPLWKEADVVPVPKQRPVQDINKHLRRIKLSRDCFSEWEAVPAGSQFRPLWDPWLFLIMINDLSVADTTLWKYVDDTTLVESVNQSGISQEVL